MQQQTQDTTQLYNLLKQEKVTFKKVEAHCLDKAMAMTTDSVGTK